MRGISMRENREARRLPVGVDDAPPNWIAGWQVGVWAGREGKAMGREPEMNGRRESDSCVVTAKLAREGRENGGGAGGGKAAGRGEHGPANRAPDSGPGSSRVECAGACAPSRDEGQGSAVHGAPASRQRRSSARGLPSVEPDGRGGGGRGDVGG